MSTTLPVIQTAGLTKTFKDFWRRNRVVAVKDLNLEIKQGEVFGLLGPNGSGKSTAIKMLLGLLYPTRGRISIFGKAPTDVQVKARIGFLPEDSYLYRFLNAKETLDYYARLFRQSGKMRAERIEHLLEMVGLTHESTRRVGEYSKGMARRIGLAQALINDPDLLILDEPTSGLDPIGTKQIKDVIRDLGKRGKTILLSSHLLADVEDVCDRVTILYGGQQRAAGTMEDLLAQEEKTQFTAEKLSDEQIEQVRTFIGKFSNKGDVKVSAPAEPLESFFLRIVRQAQTANVVTSGARAAGALPDFLKSVPQSERVIESLIHAAREPQAVESAPQRQAKPEPDRNVLEQLTAPTPPVADPEPSPGQAHTEEPSRRKEVEADRSVIDSLINPSNKSQDDNVG